MMQKEATMSDVRPQLMVDGALADSSGFLGSDF